MNLKWFSHTDLINGVELKIKVLSITPLEEKDSSAIEKAFRLYAPQAVEQAVRRRAGNDQVSWVVILTQELGQISRELMRQFGPQATKPVAATIHASMNFTGLGHKELTPSAS